MSFSGPFSGSFLDEFPKSTPFSAYDGTENEGFSGFPYLPTICSNLVSWENGAAHVHTGTSVCARLRHQAGYQRSHSVSSVPCLLYGIPVVGYEADKVENKNGKYCGTYGFDTIENTIPDCISIQYLRVTEDISICAMHCRSKSSQYCPCCVVPRVGE